AVEAGRSLCLFAAGPGVAGTAWLCNGIRRPQHCFLDRAATHWAREVECVFAGYTNRCWASVARVPVVEARYCSADFGHARGRRWVRLHSPTPGDRACE